jgi:hypothetical protein
MRTGHVDTALPATLTKRWTAELGGELTQATIADERVYAASVDQHRVYCLDRNTGNTVWCYTAGGRVDSPPTSYRGQLVFGSRDGYVYCLDAASGELAWRFRAAPIDMRISAFGHMLALDQKKDMVFGVKGFSKYGSGGSYTEDIGRVGETRYTLFCNKTSGSPTPVDGPSKRRGQASSATENLWTQPIPLRPLAMVAGGENLCVVGVEDRSSEQVKWTRLSRPRNTLS